MCGGSWGAGWRELLGEGLAGDGEGVERRSGAVAAADVTEIHRRRPELPVSPMGFRCFLLEKPISPSPFCEPDLRASPSSSSAESPAPAEPTTSG
ncbi:hypothetical protein NL676_026257 [Syzygium grande]|nr:hypothetical protein NL676_026257 [Syzygium grande]